MYRWEPWGALALAEVAVPVMTGTTAAKELKQATISNERSVIFLSIEKDLNETIGLGTIYLLKTY